jgi:lipoprotein-anchoring transpeptidase ErfK/SrfK
VPKSLNSPSIRACALLAVATLALGGCDAAKVVEKATGQSSDETTGVAAETTPTLSMNVRKGARAVPVSTLLKVKATHQKLSSVEVTSEHGPVAGKVSADGASWTAAQRLEPGTTYTVTATGTSETGDQVTKTSRFRTQALSLSQQTYPSISPLAGQTVGIGMPVIIHFDVPVTDHKSIEQSLHVTSTPAQPGSWHWLSDTEVHWRPKTYWKAGTDVTVDADINGVPAGGGIYGQMDKHVGFHIGDAHVYKVNTVTDQMRVFSNGRLIKTIPITTGEQPKYTTRSGVKVIIEKDRYHDMNSETIGIDPNSADGYNLKDVEYAMRLTYSGEFIHAAPWSVGSQGHSNVSHGCTGMSTSNAGWLFDMSQVGDVVEYVGTNRPMEFTNGYGDWNESYQDYKAGSAL